MDGTAPATETGRSEFYKHLKTKGGMYRGNPELIRLATATGYSVDHVFKVATGRRQCSEPFARAIVRETRGNKALTLESFGTSAK